MISDTKFKDRINDVITFANYDIVTRPLLLQFSVCFKRMLNLFYRTMIDLCVEVQYANGLIIKIL